jgi:beta-ribofuranosylaminobenzene 5'-phosphate synthase
LFCANSSQAWFAKTWVGFGEALTEIQRILGNYFSEVQGGVFYSNEAVELLEKLGAKGVGQSSWGPAAYGLYPTHREAEVAARQLAERLGEGWKAFAALPQNRGRNSISHISVSLPRGPTIRS